MRSDPYSWEFSLAGLGESERVEEAGGGGRKPYTTLLLVATGLVPFWNLLLEPGELLRRRPRLHGEKVERRGKSQGGQLPAKREVIYGGETNKDKYQTQVLNRKTPLRRAGFLFFPTPHQDVER